MRTKLSRGTQPDLRLTEEATQRYLIVIKDYKIGFSLQD